MESLLLFRRALSSPTMCRFIPALSVPSLVLGPPGPSWSRSLTLVAPCFDYAWEATDCAGRVGIVVKGCH